MPISKIILVLCHLPLVVAATYACWRYRELAVAFRALAWFIVCSAIANIVSLVLSFASINNMPLLHFYVAAGTVGLLWFYQRLLADYVPKWLLASVAVGFVLFCGANALWLQPVFTFSSYTLTVQSIVIIILSLGTFLLLLNDEVKAKKRDLVPSLNWINSGLFIYYTSTLVLFYFGDVLTTFASSAFLQLWTLHSALIALMYTCFFIGLWKHPRPPTS